MFQPTQTSILLLGNLNLHDGPNIDLFIHPPSFNFNEVKLILEGLLIQSIFWNLSRPRTILYVHGSGQLWTSCILKLVCYKKYNLMDDFHSLENVAS